LPSFPIFRAVGKEASLACLLAIGNGKQSKQRKENGKWQGKCKRSLHFVQVEQAKSNFVASYFKKEM